MKEGCSVLEAIKHGHFMDVGPFQVTWEKVCGAVGGGELWSQDRPEPRFRVGLIRTASGQATWLWLIAAV